MKRTRTLGIVATLAVIMTLGCGLAMTPRALAARTTRRFLPGTAAPTTPAMQLGTTAEVGIIVELGTTVASATAVATEDSGGTAAAVATTAAMGTVTSAIRDPAIIGCDHKANRGSCGIDSGGGRERPVRAFGVGGILSRFAASTRSSASFALTDDVDELMGANSIASTCRGCGESSEAEFAALRLHPLVLIGKLHEGAIVYLARDSSRER